MSFDENIWRTKFNVFATKKKLFQKCSLFMFVPSKDSEFDAFIQ